MTGVVDFNKISEVLDAIAIIRVAPEAWDPVTDQRQLTLWVRFMLSWLMNSPAGKAARVARVWACWWSL